MKTLPTIWLLTSIFILSACVGSSVKREPVSANSLDQWLSQDIAPYLTKQFSRHPRFRNTTFRFSNMSSGLIDTQSNALNQDIIQQLTDALSSQPINLLTPNGRQDCQALREARYLVGVESRVSAQGNLEVRIDAYDQAQGNWTIGFEKKWFKRLTSANESQLLEQSEDEGLRGKKFLPFRPNHAEQMISEFKQAIDCFEQQQNKTVAISQLGSYLPEELTAWMNEISGQSTPNGQPLQLIADAIDRQNRLYALTLADGDDTVLKRYIKVSREKAIVTQLDPITINPLKTPIEQPLVANIAVDLNSPILGNAALIAPQGIGLCSTQDPWELGEKSLPQNAEISNDNCFAIKFDVQRPAFPALVGRNSKGQLSLFHPTTCQYLDDAPERLDRNNTFIYPARTKPAQVLGVDDSVGQEQIYILVAANRQAQGSITALTRNLPTICEEQSSDPVAIKTWEAKLNAIKNANPGLFQWRVLSFQHVAVDISVSDDETEEDSAEDSETTDSAEPFIIE